MCEVDQARKRASDVVFCFFANLFKEKTEQREVVMLHIPQALKERVTLLKQINIQAAYEYMMLVACARHYFADEPDEELEHRFESQVESDIRMICQNARFLCYSEEELYSFTLPLTLARKHYPRTIGHAD